MLDIVRDKEVVYINIQWAGYIDTTWERFEDVSDCEIVEKAFNEWVEACA